MSSTSRFSLEQDIFTEFHPAISVRQLHENELTRKVLSKFLSTAVNHTIGISAVYGTNRVLVSISLSTLTSVLNIRFAKSGKTQPSAHRNKLLEKHILCRPDYLKLAFDMERLATALFLDHGLFITQGLDLQSLIPSSRAPRNYPEIIMDVLGGETKLHGDRVIATFVIEDAHYADPSKLAMRAWASAHVATEPDLSGSLPLQAVSRVNTRDLPRQHLELLAKFVRNTDRLHAMKPTTTKNDVKSSFKLRKDGALNATMTSFRSRMRECPTQKQIIRMTSAEGAPMCEVNARVINTRGKQAWIKVNGPVSKTGRIESVYTIGRDAPTLAEVERTYVVLHILQGVSDLFGHPTVRRIFGFRDDAPPVKRPKLVIPTFFLGGRQLNHSQATAVARMKSEHPADKIVLVHGPPGTGKTSVIAAYVCDAHASQPNPVGVSTKGKGKEKGGIWLVAQSNVAVKNIAEKLASIEFLDFKLLVSLDFHFDWHEHLYKKIEPLVIRSDEFFEDLVITQRLLAGSRVILCTLSMFSHPRMQSAGYTILAPIETVIVDEASQIELGSYLPLLSKSVASLKKLVFIGDDKQLAPYGQDDLRDLSSIFEMKHLRGGAIFLDTQYRMPTPIGAFISKHVYSGKLKTQHAISTRSACCFIDIAHGQEASKGKSWINTVEADAAVKVARLLHKRGWAFKIITPYDPQRDLIEKKLTEEKVPWENTCFNVDSFQGNEEDFIIISVVRTAKIGFLNNLRRTNVMLSRCKRGMFVCAKTDFLLNNENAKGTLVGKMAQEWSTGRIGWRDLLAGAV